MDKKRLAVIGNVDEKLIAFYPDHEVIRVEPDTVLTGMTFSAIIVGEVGVTHEQALELLKGLKHG